MNHDEEQIDYIHLWIYNINPMLKWVKMGRGTYTMWSNDYDDDEGGGDDNLGDGNHMSESIHTQCKCKFSNVDCDYNRMLSFSNRTTFISFFPR